MQDKQHFNRVQWVRSTSSEGTAPVENNPVPWAISPGEAGYPQQFHGAQIPQGGYIEGEDAFIEENVLSDDDFSMEDGYDEEMYDEEIYDEQALLEQQRLQEEAERRTLRDALLILVALYIICGVAPLFLGLFVPLRIFFYLEMGGWVIILAWLIFGVRRPLMRWFREWSRKRKEEAESLAEAGEQIIG